MSRRPSQDRPRPGMYTARDAVRQFLEQSGLGAKLRDEPVYRAWHEAVGEALARRARAVDFRRGELIVEVGSAAQQAELTGFTGERYRQLTNRRLGREVVRRVTFKLER